ncbi:hypothetical protein HYY73_02465 [Candidatus Woesearchaeota archaeon]|nr:hypothetical protein [Candidatus Woesearchaeota archaeon]
MKEIETKSGVIDVSVDVLRQYAAQISKQFPAQAPESEEIAADFIKFDLEDVLRLVESKGFPHLNNIRALVAHGKSDKAGNYWYTDRTASNETVPLAQVQQWVDRHDGRYGVLLIYSCNTSGAQLSSRASFLVYPSEGIFTSEDIKRARYDRESNLLFQPPQGVRQGLVR